MFFNWLYCQKALFSESRQQMLAKWPHRLLQISLHPPLSAHTCWLPLVFGAFQGTRSRRHHHHRCGQKLHPLRLIQKKSSSVLRETNGSERKRTAFGEGREPTEFCFRGYRSVSQHLQTGSTAFTFVYKFLMPQPLHKGPAAGFLYHNKGNQNLFILRNSLLWIELCPSPPPQMYMLKS